MTNATRKAGVGAWTAMALLVASTAWADAPTVTLSLGNVACVPRWTTEAAQDVVVKAYEEIGVRVVWTDQKIKNGPGLLTIVMLPAWAEKPFLSGPGASPNTLGFAPPGSGRVYVFCARVFAFARSYHRSMALVLGHVLTHEIGHQLLPGRGHASTGIMREELNYGLAVEALFAPEQGASIRALLTTHEHECADDGDPSNKRAATKQLWP